MSKNIFFSKHLLAQAFFFLILISSQAQITNICDEKFSSKLPQGWSIQPQYSTISPSWRTDTSVTATANYAMHADIPYSNGDTTELVTPYYDCSSYKHVILRFKHICKVLPSDICEIQYQEQGLGPNYKWKTIPNDSYLGNCLSYKTNLSFSHTSYSTWKANDTFAQPNSGWFKEEIFDLSNYASYSKVRFRFILRKGNYFGSYIASGWYVDDFQLLGSSFIIKPPVVEFLSAPQYTVYSTGPYAVNAKVASRSTYKIIPPVLECQYTYNNKTLKSQLPMQATSGDSIWTTNIPQQVYGTSVSYSITASDSAGNTASASADFYAQWNSSIQYSHSVALYAIDQPTASSAPGLQPVKISLKNKGFKNLTSAIVNWTVNGVLQTPKTYTGNLPCDFIDTLFVGNYTQRANTYDTLVLWVSMPNQVSDSMQNDDTLHIHSYGCAALHGSYSIGKNGRQRYDFSTLNDFIQLFNRCGMSGDVTLKLESGIYTQALDVSAFNGNPYRITITSIGGNADSVIFIPVSGTTVNLNGKQKLEFKHISLINNSYTDYAVSLGNGTKDVIFNHCRITAPGIVIRQDHNGNIADIRFTGNEIIGEINICGASNSQRNTNIVFDSNHVTTVTSGHKYGIRMEYGNRLTVSHNYIQEANAPLKDFDGISIYASDTCIINANHIHARGYANDYQHGIYCYYLDSNSLISNNEIIMVGSGSVYGFCIEYPSGTRIINNSILVSGKSSRTYGGIYITGNFQCQVLNNLSVTRGATYSYPMFITSSYGLGQCLVDYNNLWGDKYIGNIGSSISSGSMNTYRSLLPSAVHDFWQRPAFIDSTLSLELNNYNGMACPQQADVPYDINGEQRTNLTSIGAYGVRFYEGINLSILEFVSPQPQQDIACYSPQVPVSIVISNLGIPKADFKKSALKINIDVDGAINYHFDTTLVEGSISFMQKDTLSLGNIPTLISGQYNIHVSLSDTADKISNDDTLSLMHKAYHIELPYDIDFSTIPNEFESSIMTGNTLWKVVQGNGNNPNLSPVFGTGRLEFSGYMLPGSSANAIFNAINIYECLNPKLSFWYAHNADCKTSDMLMVFITTDEGATFKEIKRISVADTLTAWKQYDIDLTPYNQYPCLSIVFRAVGFGGSDQSIDRIRITAEKDVAIELLPIDLSQRSACDSRPIDLKAIVSNKSRMGIDLSNDTISLNITGATNQSYKYVYNKKLSGLERDTLILGQLDLSVNGSINLELYMQSFDDNPLNDTLRDSSIYIMQDVSLDSLFGIDHHSTQYSGDSVRLSAVVVNKGNIPADQLLLHTSLNGKEVLCDTLRQHLKAGESLIHQMSKPYIVPHISKEQPYYFLEVWIELECDGNTTNDSISFVKNVSIPDTIDIQLLDITTASPAKGKTKIAPSVRIANIGNLEANNLILHVNVIDSGHTVVDSISETINHMAVNETKNYTFTMNYRVPNYTGTYSLKAYVEACQGDGVRSNDTLSKTFANEVDDTRIRERKNQLWILGQNIPNPAKHITHIPFHLPLDAEVIFSVMSANGQLIYKEKISAHSGDNFIKLDIQTFSSGIYYYCMEYKGERIIRKMNIIQ